MASGGSKMQVKDIKQLDETFRHQGKGPKMVSKGLRTARERSKMLLYSVNLFSVYFLHELLTI